MSNGICDTKNPPKLSKRLDCVIMHEEDDVVEKRHENSKRLKIMSVNFILTFQIIKDLL